MGKVNFAENRKTAEKEGLITSGDYLKLKEGDNRIRIMSEAIPHTDVYDDGRKRDKWLCYVLDRRDGAIKPFFMPKGIYSQIEALQESDDYAFDEVPMPYDIAIRAEGAGTKQVKYSVVPARKNTPLTAAEEADLATKKPLTELQEMLRRNRGEPEAVPTEDAEVPF